MGHEERGGGGEGVGRDRFDEFDMNGIFSYFDGNLLFVSHAWPNANRNQYFYQISDILWNLENICC